MNPIFEKLIKLGLSEKQSKVYISLLELGMQPASVVSRKTGISRSSVFFIAGELIEKGLANKIIREKVTYFSAEGPDKLTSMLKKEATKINKKQNLLSEIAPLLSALHNPSAKAPQARYYEGMEGLKQLYIDTLESSTDIEAVATLRNIHPEFLEWLTDEYVPMRVEKKIFAKVLVSDTHLDEKYLAKDHKCLRKTLLVPEKYSGFFNAEINIYNKNKVSISSFSPHEMVGVIIESPAVYDTMHGMFMLAFDQAQMLGSDTFLSMK